MYDLFDLTLVVVVCFKKNYDMSRMPLNAPF